MTQTFVYFDDCFKSHVQSLDYPECSDRVQNIIELINKEEFKNIIIKQPNKIEQSLISAAHEEKFVRETLARFPSDDQIVFLDQETPVSKGSLDATLRAAGAGIDAVDAIMSNNIHNAFCIVRPPGHHACYDRSMGFCVFNNVAIAAHYLINKYKFKNIAIIDFDVHHGNGTQDIFYNNEKVLYISSHQYPYYPGSGSSKEKGYKDNVLNIPLPAGTKTHEFLNAYEDIFKKLKGFKPEFILLSAGFDAHKDDPLAQINLESKDYYTLTKRIMTLAKELCGEKIVSILEGGYDLNALKESVNFHVKSLIEN